MKYFSFLLLFFLLASTACFGNLKFIDNGTSAYSVVVQNTSQSILNPANFFRYYVKKATGFNLPITDNKSNILQVNFQLSEKIANDAFTITINHGNIRIAGGNQQGLYSAVTYILENYLQVAFLSVEVINVPSLKEVRLPDPFSISKKPDFDNRMIHSLEGYSQDYIQTHGLDMPFLKSILFPNSFNEHFLPAKNYFFSHPEYYITVDGKADTSQPNLLQPAVEQIVFNSILDKSKKTSDNNTYYNIFLNDNPKISNSNSAIQFSKNMGFNFSDIYYGFVNKIASNFPKLNFLALAYEQTKNIPNKTVPVKNVTIVLTNADNNKSKSITTDDFDVQQHLYMKQLISKWIQIDSTLIYWDYLTNYSNPLMPWPNLYTIKPNIIYYKKMGLKNLFFQLGGFYLSEASELKGYLCSKLMFDTQCSEDSLIQKFCTEFYEKAGKYMYSYFSEINSIAFKSNILMYTYDGPLKFSETLFSYKNVVKWQQLLQLAEKSNNTASVNKRIKKEKLGLDYVYLELSTKKPGWNNSASKQMLVKRVNDFEKEANEINLGYISDDSPNIKAYVNKLRQKIL